MKILITTGIFPPDIGGPASYVPAAAMGLSRRGHEVTVVTLADFPELKRDHQPEGYRVIRLDRELPWILRLIAAVAAIWREARKAEVVFAAGLAFEAALASKLARRPFVCKIVGDSAWERSVVRGWYRNGIEAFQTARKGMAHRLLDFMRAYPARAAKIVITPCVFLRRIVSRWAPQARIAVIPNACYAAVTSSIPEQANAESSGPFKGRFNGVTMITVCRLVPWKKVDELIGLVARTRNYRLIVVGDGPMFETWQTTARRLFLDDRVVFMGGLEQDKVLDVMSKADIFVLNSTYEGFPHVILEAAEAGIPVVAAACGGVPELVLHGQTGLLFAPGDIGALTRCLDRLDRDPELAYALALAARNRLDAEFSFNGMVARTESVLLAACGKEVVE